MAFSAATPFLPIGHSSRLRYLPLSIAEQVETNTRTYKNGYIVLHGETLLCLAKSLIVSKLVEYCKRCLARLGSEVARSTRPTGLRPRWAEGLQGLATTRPGASTPFNISFKKIALSSKSF